ncbi:MAG: glycosyltransferase family 39 protein [Candidatus Auribacterota bacterium]|jgi:hypothetical protein|nr:glycosyltransferase family 39 protein [Candidatus Auribacterota bacterium]
MKSMLQFIKTCVSQNKKIALSGIFILTLVPTLYLRFSQAIVFDILFGYDGQCHLQYIIDLYKKRSLPSPLLLLEGYQPPLYYFFSSLIMHFTTDFGEPAHITLKLLSVSTGLLLFACACKTYRYMHSLFGNSRLPLAYGVIFMAYLPVHLYISPMVTNELLSSFLISVALFFTVRCIERNDYSLRSGAVLGCILGLSLLTKYTGLIMATCVAVALCVLILTTRKHRKTIAGFAVVCFAVTILISGWWYVRNAVKYGDPLITSAGLTEFNHIYEKMPPGNRLLSDFITFDRRVFHNPMLAQRDDRRLFNPVYRNILTGTLATIWIENHNLYLRISDKTGYAVAGCLLTIGLISTLYMIAGFLLFIRKSWAVRNFSSLPVIILPPLSLAAYIFFNIQHPYFCHIKAIFLLHLFIPAILGYCYASHWVIKRNVIAVVLHHAVLAAQILLVILLYGLYSRY